MRTGKMSNKRQEGKGMSQEIQTKQAIHLAT